MLINTSDINKILNRTDSSIITRGKRYFEASKVNIKEVNIDDDNNYDIVCFVQGSKKYKVNIIKKNDKIVTKCNCPYCDNYEYITCKHIIATLFDIYTDYDKYYTFVDKKISVSEYFNKSLNNDEDFNVRKFNSYLESHSIFAKKFLKDFQEDNVSDIVNYYINSNIQENDLVADEKVTLLPMIEVINRPFYNSEEFYMYFKIGRDKYYIIKNVKEFLSRIRYEEIYTYGKELSFKHMISNFDEFSQNLISIIAGAEEEEYNKRNVLLNGFVIDGIFDICLNKEIMSNLGNIKFVDENPKINIKIERVNNDKDKITIKEKYKIIEGLKNVYIYIDNYIYRCNNDFRKNVLPLLKENARNDSNIILKRENEMHLVNFILPLINKYCNVKCEQQIIQQNELKHLEVKTYLDINSNSNVVCNVQYCYDNITFNPYDSKENKSINFIEEMKYNKLFEKLGFQIDINNKNLIMLNEEKIYEFLDTGLQELIQKCEVLATDKFKTRQIIKPKSISFGVSVKNNLLELEFDNMNLNEEELKKILQSYSIKKKYYKLKNGNFIDLSSSALKSIIDISNELEISPKEIAAGKAKLEKYRAVHINNVLDKDEYIVLNKDKKFKEIIKDISCFEDTTFEIPKNLKATLRKYQITGFNWLKTLEKYNFGGVLADDMGLGKTIQIICLILSSANYEKSTSIIICPSSLYLNWQKEFERFAPDLKVQVISGSGKIREDLIKNIDSYDVVITSYDLLKRDVELYQKYNFKYIIADEAQYIKNSNTKNSKSLKSLKGSYRFALTGTPLENSLAELWSIFDFIMPGYLFSYAKFREKFEKDIVKEEENMSERLKYIISPFVLRRVKKDVLKDLPDKTETIMYNEMNEEQKNIYMSYLLEAKKELNQEIENVGFSKSQIKILALITRLRQICCHPSLFLENYLGESSKLEQCVEVLKEAITSGHKILLFSGFTSMLDLIEAKLNNENIKYYKLTGQTKVDERLDLVEKFNNFDDVKVFLVSLKAGGTGLNLIGADMVMHFDPWWNLSVENQATDRAYRIGQKNNVQVFKYITKNSIEEKIQEIQNRKKDLFDKVINKGENFITKMSKEDILKLFEE